MIGTRAKDGWQTSMGLRHFPFVFLLACLLFQGGCARDPRALEITRENRAKVVKKVERSKKLSAEEKRLFAAFMGREEKLGEKGTSSAGKNVAQVIEEERSLEKDLKDLTATLNEVAEVFKKYTDAVKPAKPKHPLSFAVVAFRLTHSTSPYAGSELDYLCENKSDRSIREFEGRLILSDTEGREVDDIPIQETEELPAGESRNRTMYLSYIFHPQIRPMLSGEGQRLNWQWRLTSYTFTDGSRVWVTPPAD